MRSLWFVGMVVSGCAVVDRVEEDEVSFAGPVQSVVADLGAGDLTVRIADVTEATVRRTLRWTGDPPQLDAWVEGDALRLGVECRAGQWVCRVDHEVLLPETAAIDAHLGSGDVWIEGLSSPITVDVGSGDVDLYRIVGDAVLTAGSGDLTVEELEGTLDAEAHSGDVTLMGATSTDVVALAGSGDLVLDLAAAPLSLLAETGSGDVDLYLPSGAYRVHTDTGSGDVAIDGIDNVASADHVVDVSTGSGDITIDGH